MPLVEADLRSALRVQAFEMAVGEPQQIVVEGMARAKTQMLAAVSTVQPLDPIAIAISSAARSRRTSAPAMSRPRPRVVPAERARRLPRQGRLRARRPRRRARGLPAARATVARGPETRRRSADPARGRRGGRPGAGAARRRTHGAQFPAAPVGHRHPDAAVRRRRRRPRSRSSTRARPRRRCARSKSTPSAPAAPRTIGSASSMPILIKDNHVRLAGGVKRPSAGARAASRPADRSRSADSCRSRRSARRRRRHHPRRQHVD